MTPPLLVLQYSAFSCCSQIKGTAGEGEPPAYIILSFCYLQCPEIFHGVFLVVPQVSSSHMQAKNTPYTITYYYVSPDTKKNSTFCSLKYSTVILSFNSFSLTLSLIHISCFTMLFREALCWSWIHFLFPKHWGNYDFCESKNTSMFRNLKLFLFCSGIWKKTDSSEGYGSNF